MVFTQNVGQNKYIMKHNENNFRYVFPVIQSCPSDILATMYVSMFPGRVCYSFHASMSEVKDMVLYLKPQRAFANVVTRNTKSLVSVYMNVP